MRKILLKLILTLFILGVINPAAYSLSELCGGELTDYYHVRIKKTSQALPLVENVHLKSIVSHAAYGFVKPIWAGDLYFSANYVFNTGRSSSFLQKANAFHRQQYLQLQLFPPHFFG